MTRAFVFFYFLTVAPFLGAAVSPLQDLEEEPAIAYRTSADLEDTDYELAVRVAAEWPRLRFSSPLAAVARAYAQASEKEAPATPSSSDIRRMLKLAGLPESDAVAATVLTTEEGPSDVLDHLRTIMAKVDATHVGLGRHPSRIEPYRWRWAIMLVDRQVELQKPVPRTVAPGGALVLSFSPRDGFSGPEVLVQYPDGRTRELAPARSHGGWFTVVPIGETTGRLVIQILAADQTGPRGIAGMPIHVSTVPTNNALPGVARQLPSADGITTPEAAANYLFEVVNEERLLHGLQALEWDVELAEMAEAHSADMVANRFFGHTSPGNGDLRRRMTANGYRAAVFRENLAKDIDPANAHASLMASPGHRSNLLSEDVSLVGIGVVREKRLGELHHWVVTEIFAKPLSQIVIPSTYPYSASQPSTCKRHKRLDSLAQWLLDHSEATGEVSTKAETRFRKRLDNAGIGWKSMQTRFHYFSSLEHAETASIVGHKHFTLCGAAAAQVSLPDGRIGFLRAEIFLEPIQRIP